MKTFDVYKHPALGYQAVKQGFGWPAFFFTVVWAVVKKMWGYAFAFLGVIVSLTVVENVFRQAGSEGGVKIVLITELAFFVIVGIKSNDWRRSHLQQRGFEKLSAVQAATPDAAIAQVARPDGERQAEIT